MLKDLFLGRLLPPNVEKLTKKRNVKGLIEALGYRNGSNDTSRKAAEALVLIGASAVESLIAALNDGSESVRGCAAWALGKIGDDRAVEPLIAALRGGSELMREHAASALGKIGDDRAVEPLIAALEDSNEFVRGNAASALGRLHDDRALQPLSDLLQDKSLFVQEKATVALYRLRSPEERAKRNGSTGRPPDARLAQQ
ncbi:MAG: HEAT repeat domain-containing protein [Chloroflexota bacterium]